MTRLQHNRFHIVRCNDKPTIVIVLLDKLLLNGIRYAHRTLFGNVATGISRDLNSLEYEVH
jgi:hypothetical protein